MKIKLAFLDQDKGYLSRVVSAFGSKYPDNFEIYSFTDPAMALETVNTAKIDVLLASDSFELDVARLPQRCAFAYLVASGDIDTFNGQCAVCKFQKADLIYKQILNIYSEKASAITGFKLGGEENKLIAFCSASGGVGGSTMAAACAVHFAAQHKKVLYLNLETFGSSEAYFSCPGQFTMSDIIFALKSKKANLSMKLESCVRQDRRGVYFYSPATIALDMMELDTEAVLLLISELSGEYDYIILDMPFSLDRNTMSIYNRAHALVLVGDGSAESNLKAERAYTALTTMEKSSDQFLSSRTAFLYNKVSSTQGQSVNLPGLKVLGGAPKYTGAGAQQIVDQLATMSFFDNIV